MSQCFQNAFGRKKPVIIDCFEVFIERPSNLLARARTCPYYKHHNTIKFLIGITSLGSISFVSEAWSWRTPVDKVGGIRAQLTSSAHMRN